ncbi:MAG TPA: cysteine desulfurase [Flavobacteriales bacterium]|nr:cysteine desulfurase [Flavobacteriales bacterium]HPH82584.1 cysteine desulfurase [Flavobacteriales bacterium]
MNTLPFDVELVRRDFPILHQEVNGNPLVYFDNGATSQKPQQVIDAMVKYYSTYNANIHRGVHHLSQLATSAYEQAREEIRAFLNASKTEEIIFTSGTTDGINLIAQSWGRNYLKPGDEIVVTAMEHHANIVPWQLVCEQTGAVLKVIPMDTNGELILEEARKLIGLRTRMVSIIQVSNALGTINPVREILAMAREFGAMTLIDGAQAVPHFKVDVQELDCDFYVFSAHKILGPTGVGILYGKQQLLDQLPPWKGGGDMIRTVTFEKTTYNDAPLRFEAGTPNISGGIVMAEGIRYWNSLNHEAVQAYEKDLLQYGTNRLKEIEGVRIIGEAKEKVAVISFIMEDLHPYDIGFILDKKGIALRTGHHCAQPVMDFFGIPGTLRASFSFYNTQAEIDRMVDAIGLAKKMLQ